MTGTPRVTGEERGTQTRALSGVAAEKNALRLISPDCQCFTIRFVSARSSVYAARQDGKLGLIKHWKGGEAHDMGTQEIFAVFTFFFAGPLTSRSRSHASTVSSPALREFVPTPDLPDQLSTEFLLRWLQRPKELIFMVSFLPTPPVPARLTVTEAILSIERTATKDDIRRAYRKAALASHPDKVQESEREDAEIRFKAVSQAYDILYDDEKRQLYDTHGMTAFDGSGRPGMAPPDLDDIINSMFGMGVGGGMPGYNGPGGPSKPKKGSNEEHAYGVSLEDLYKGRTVKFASTKNVICSLCKGKGGKEKATPKTCLTCGGLGRKEAVVQIAPGLMTQSMTECNVCDGLGHFFQAKDKCKKCKGSRVTEERKLLEIYIPRGAKHGDRIVLEGEGDQIPGVEPGDIVFQLEEAEHEVFKRAGGDLQANLRITLSEALCGFSRVVLKHLDGRGLELKHPKTPGDVLRPGQVLKVSGEGMPFKRSEAWGDLYLTVHVIFPKDGWALNQAMLDTMRGILPAPEPRIEADTVDEVEFDPKANIEDFGAKDAQGGSAWEDDEEEDGGTQCAAQ
ncbi:DnaJ-like protein xdj1 [Ophidiomyces ophidiicola]|nr:DnaJ-like protein xdj1 [Ophidiomyces ophidiicola]KAI1980301.1 DnaJ-like protein xdj1 [Ophidiomyces ophidiicola]KAI1982154.1 DnaJ-like protein xdj1 [Ophidiomyces ophidiicola]KAI1987894.1 DnaJ-like protein xdj1 [Ophidiomyces ophidiicola]